MRHVLGALGALALVIAGLAAATTPVTIRLHTIGGTEVPVVQVLARTGSALPGYIFLAEKQGGKPGGPIILDSRGRIAWYHQVAPPLEVTDFRTQLYRGKRVLTWWQGTQNKAGVGKGEYEIYDAAYRHLATVRAGHGLRGDLHEFQLTRRGTAFITAYREVPANLVAVGGPRHGYALDSIVQEIDVASGRVLFEWRSVGHIPFSESTHANHEPARNATRKRPFDYFHVNSVADGPNGTVLISGRNVSTIYLLRRDGRVVWRLGGKRSDFGPKAAVRFAFQHDARLHGNTLSLFDNGGIPRVEPRSRPLVLRLDVAARRARLVRTFEPPVKIASPYEGNLDLLRNGAALVGWGGVPQVTEFAADGSVALQLKLPYGDTYRATYAQWHARPAAPPAVAVEHGTVYASWNGATGIARWQLLAGSDAAHLKPAGGQPWQGLETSLPLPGKPGAIAVRALDVDGRVLGRSRAVEP